MDMNTIILLVAVLAGPLLSGLGGLFKRSPSAPATPAPATPHARLLAFLKPLLDAAKAGKLDASHPIISIVEAELAALRGQQ